MAIGPQLARVLKQYGLESLTQWASNALINGLSEDQIVLEMWDRQEFRTRFAGMFAHEANGHGVMSPDEWLNYESTVKSTASMWGMTLTQDEINTIGANNVSAQEFDSRAQLWATAVYDSPPEVRDELERLFGITGGQLMRYWIDPKKELGALQQQFRMGQLAGAALQSNYGQLTAGQAQRLADSGMDPGQAVTAFGQFAAAAELFSPLDFGEEAISRDLQIEALAGDAEAAGEIEQRGQRRVAEFEGGGSYAAGEEGFATGSAR